MIFLGLELHADTSPLAPGEHRRLTVSVAGTTAKISLEAKNLAPDVAELWVATPCVTPRPAALTTTRVLKWSATIAATF